MVGGGADCGGVIWCARGHWLSGLLDGGGGGFEVCDGRRWEEGEDLREDGEQ